MMLTNANTISGRNGVKVEVSLTFDLDYAASAKEMVKMLEESVKTTIESPKWKKLIQTADNTRAAN